MAYEFIGMEQEEGLAIITFRRPDKLNALAEGARLIPVFSRRALVPDLGLTYFLPRMLGIRRLWTSATGASPSTQTRRWPWASCTASCPRTR